MSGQSGAERVDELNHVAIIGGGFSGTLQAIALLRAGLPRVTLIERRGDVGRGVAYSTDDPGHLLNVRTANMSAFQHDADHFRRWLAGRTSADPQGFASRRDYGDYLAELLHDEAVAAPDRLAVTAGGVVEVEPRSDGVAISLDDGRRIAADAVILAIGNLPPNDPPGLAAATLPPDVFIVDPWSGPIANGLGEDDDVLLIGTGLTMVDVALSLEADGFAGRIFALSRRGLLPRAHDSVVTATAEPMALPAARGAALVRAFRDDAARHGWRTTVDRFRPHVQAIWQRATEAERRRFLRHLRPWWDVHRHRLSPRVAARINALVASGKLTTLAGRIRTAIAGDRGVQVTWRSRHEGADRTLRASRIVNCTGPQGDLLRTREPLLHFLLAAGRVRADPLRLGIDVSEACETIDINGLPNPRLLAIGPMTRGAFWEIVAVPDIRVQTWALARRLAERAGSHERGK